MFEYDRPMVEQATDDFDLVLRNACRAALKKGLVSDPTDMLVVTAGLPFGTPGTYTSLYANAKQILLCIPCSHKPVCLWYSFVN